MLAQQMMAPARRLPFITTLHGTDITLVGIDSSYLGITRFSIQQSDAVTAVSENLRQSTFEHFEICREIEVIYNFVNCETYKRIDDPAARARFALEGEKILTHLSNFRAVKRVTDAVEIFAKVRERVPAKLLLVGDGPERAAAELLAHKRGVHDHTLFLGKQDNVEQILGVSDLLLMPSEMESFGLAALEAMACEVPPIASRVGGVPELVTHGVDGLLAPAGDVATMAEDSIRLLQNPGLHREFAKAARKTALTRFCSTLIIPRYEELYRRVLERTQ
jgi:N-acetyl-alpha-D-glucosaminyl L-malate synthase BshA